MITVKLWTGRSYNINAKSVTEALKCLRALDEDVKDLVRTNGEPTSLLLVFVNGRELSVLEELTLKDGDLVELVPVLHRG